MYMSTLEAETAPRDTAIKHRCCSNKLGGLTPPCSASLLQGAQRLPIGDDVPD